MYVGPVRRKKINLWLLILIILFIVAIIFTIIHVLNSSKANSDYRYSQRNEENSVAAVASADATNSVSNKKNNSVAKESNGSRIGIINSTESFADIDSSPRTTTTIEVTSHKDNNENKSENVELGGHKFNFKDLGKASLKGDYVELKKGDILYKICTEQSSFDSTKGKENLKSYLESKYKIQVTSDFKVGTLNGVSMIICTIAETTGVGYLIITPLNDNEIICMKVYDANNLFGLIKDLSTPINDINELKSNIQ